MKFDLQTMPSQKGRVAIVTGSNVGLGYETALGLIKKEIKVILACRNAAKAEQAKKDLLKEVPEAELEIILIDLSRMASVKAFAQTFLEQYDRLDLLINNAGLLVPKYQETEDGFEVQWATNYLGHFLLTGLLLPTLLKTANSRVVSLSSLSHRQGEIKFDNLNRKKRFSGYNAYAQSKLACLMYGYELQRRLEAHGYTQTISTIAHPGISITSVGRNLPKLAMWLASIFEPLISHKPNKGALPTLWAALAPADGGDYFGPKGWRQIKGAPGKVSPAKRAKDEAVAKRLWEVSEELLGFKYSF
jgi:NAD(P)-dependent dehydrogenase (short-subunit alcohol dehydrogenase family)